MVYGLGYLIKDTDNGNENIAGIIVSKPASNKIHIEAQLLLNQPSSIIPALHFMELLYQENLADNKIKILTANATLIEKLNIENPIEIINYNKKIIASKSETEDYFGINVNLILLHPLHTHNPGTVLQTYGQFIINAYQTIPDIMKPRGIWIPSVNENAFYKAIEAAKSNIKSSGTPNLAVEFNESETIMCYFFKKSGSKALKEPKNSNRIDLSKCLLGYA